MRVRVISKGVDVARVAMIVTNGEAYVPDTSQPFMEIPRGSEVDIGKLAEAGIIVEFVSY
jgi:hypothetical protein